MCALVEEHTMLICKIISATVKEGLKETQVHWVFITVPASSSLTYWIPATVEVEFLYWNKMSPPQRHPCSSDVTPWGGEGCQTPARLIKRSFRVAMLSHSFSLPDESTCLQHEMEFWGFEVWIQGVKTWPSIWLTCHQNNGEMCFNACEWCAHTPRVKMDSKGTFNMRT